MQRNNNYLTKLQESAQRKQSQFNFIEFQSVSINNLLLVIDANVYAVVC